MTGAVKSSDDIYRCTTLFTCKEIKLFAWHGNEGKEAMIVFTGTDDFIYHNMNMEKPVVKEIAWLKDQVHFPVAICFSPSGCFLLVVSLSCHLYILPICSDSKCSCQYDRVFNVTDMTILIYPFNWRKKFKSSNSFLNVSPTESPLLNKEDTRKDSTPSPDEKYVNGNELILKETSNMQNEVSAQSVCWWHTPCSSREVGIIGTKSGYIIFVDLVAGVKVREVKVKGPVKALQIYQDTLDDIEFLLITVDNDDQYKLSLDEKYLDSTTAEACKREGRDAMDEIPARLRTSNGNGCNTHSPSSRTRLQGLKQMSAVKLASLKNKIAETRSKMAVKQETPEGETCSKGGGAVPESIGSMIGETFLFPQRWNGENVLAGYYDHSQLLTIHSTNLGLVPRSVHKLPSQTEEVLLCNRVICVVSKGRRSVEMVSSKLTETGMEEATEFNRESVLGKWCFEDVISRTEGNDGFAGEDSEVILNICKAVSKQQEFDVGKMYKLERPKEGFPECPLTENCVVVTNRNVRVIHLKSNLLKIVLDLILEAHELEKAERICTIFGLNLQKLLELAGDIKLNIAEFPTAIALYKLSKCGLLKSIVKLACGSHCLQVLNYSMMLMSNSTSEMPLTEKIHLSNLIIMAYIQQILKTENNRKLLEKFTDFLHTNSYFDEVLAVSITGQSLLFSCLHKLIVEKGLIFDGYNILIKLMERFCNSKALDWSLNKEEFWRCATEPSLIEAMVVAAGPSFFIYSNYVLEHLEELSSDNLKRLSAVLDPTAACLRPLARIHTNSPFPLGDNDDSQSVFPFGELVQLFAVTLLGKAYKSRNMFKSLNQTFLRLVQEENNKKDVSESVELFDDFTNETDEMWFIRKHFQVSVRAREKWRKSERRLSCGFGHAALIRNGAVYTWGQTAKGCLGQGPTMMRNAFPAPVSWLNQLRLQVSMVACGKNHTAVVTDNGVYTWGCSKYGQLGLGDVEKSPYPRLVTGLANERVTLVSCGQFHTMALTGKGSVFAWGWGVHGQLGLGNVDDQRVPIFVRALKEHVMRSQVIIDVAAGHGHTLVLSDKGHVYAFGSSVFGQLGTGTTAKHSSPVVVKGFCGKVTTLATGYFHNLALTESNSLYTWGMSPQCLRYQAQARKKSKLLQGQSCASDYEYQKSPMEDQSPRERPEQSDRSERNLSELHLSPTLVDTSNVNGKIVQIACGCHHSALVTESGALFTWGRSLDGQLGAGGHREVHTPTQIGEQSWKVDEVSCGCEFTAAQEKDTGKIYAWGSNSVGQLGLPIKESATKSLDGKLVMLKSCKRIVRLLDRNAGSNSSDVPREISEIPPPTFTYQTLRKQVDSDLPNLSVLDPDYGNKSLCLIIENFHQCIDMNLLLNKSLDYGNFHVASKIALLQNNHKQAMVYQLKGLQSLHKYQGLVPPYSAVSVEDCCPEGPSVSVRSEALESGEGFKSRYLNLARSIVAAYLDLESGRTYDQNYTYAVLETAIQFWTAEKLEPGSLELLLEEKLKELFCDINYFLFWENLTTLLSFFSTRFLMELIRKMLLFLEENDVVLDYVEAMSKALRTHDDQKEPKWNFQGMENNKSESEWRLESIEENLRNLETEAECIKISGDDLSSNNAYFFSCGHHYSPRSLNQEILNIDEGLDCWSRTGLIQVYGEMKENKRSDLACPRCVRGSCS